MNIRVGLCTIAFQKEPLEKIFDLAAGEGIDCVEIWGKENHLPLDAGSGKAAAVARMASQRDLPIFSYGSYVRVFDEESDENFKKAVEMTVALSAGILRVWAGGGPSAEANMEETLPVLAEKSRRLAEIAEQAGIIAAFECHAHNLIDSSDCIVSLLQTVNRSNLRSYYQILVEYNGEDPYMQAERLAPYTVAAHVHNVYESDLEPRYLESGTLDYPKIASLLAEGGFSGPLFIEFVDSGDPVAAFRKDAAFLKSIKDM